MRHDILAEVHKVRKPSVYLEIGVLRGKSLQFANCYSMAVDPDFQIKDMSQFSQQVDFFEMSSDEFFGRNNITRKPDLVFIDGLHLFEQTLKDFINVEKNSHTDTMVVFDDVLPKNEKWGTRKRPPKPKPWTGDVWKIIPILRQYRPDLKLEILFPESPGLLSVTGLDSTNTVLQDNYDKIVRGWKDTQYNQRQFTNEFKKLRISDIYSEHRAEG